MDDFILEVENTLPPEFCQDIIKKFEEDPDKKPGVTLAGLRPDVKRSTDLALDVHSKKWRDIYVKLYDTLWSKVFGEYTEYLYKLPNARKWWNNEIIGPIKSIKCFQIQRVKKGEHYTWHSDALTSSERVLTFIFYLNTLDEEDGGATEFHNGLKVQPVEGKLLLFPATWTYVHRGCEVTGKTKYIITGWIYGAF